MDSPAGSACPAQKLLSASGFDSARVQWCQPCSRWANQLDVGVNMFPGCMRCTVPAEQMALQEGPWPCWYEQDRFACTMSTHISLNHVYGTCQHLPGTCPMTHCRALHDAMRDCFLGCLTACGTCMLSHVFLPTSSPHSYSQSHSICRTLTMCWVRLPADSLSVPHALLGSTTQVCPWWATCHLSLPMTSHAI